MMLLFAIVRIVNPKVDTSDIYRTDHCIPSIWILLLYHTDFLAALSVLCGNPAMPDSPSDHNTTSFLYQISTGYLSTILLHYQIFFLPQDPEFVDNIPKATAVIEYDHSMRRFF